MLEYHEQIDNDLMNLITKFRTEIIKENSKNNLIRKNEFFLKKMLLMAHFHLVRH